MNVKYTLYTRHCAQSLACGTLSNAFVLRFFLVQDDIMDEIIILIS